MTDRRYTYFNLWDTADPRYMYMNINIVKNIILKSLIMKDHDFINIKSFTYF